MRNSPRALLDVNVLIALFHPEHVHHQIAHDWFADQEPQGWATCPLTENGFLRILTNPRGPVQDRRAIVFASLNSLCASEHHEFWPDSVSLRDDSLLDSDVHVSYLQLIDLYRGSGKTDLALAQMELLMETDANGNEPTTMPAK